MLVALAFRLWIVLFCSTKSKFFFFCACVRFPFGWMRFMFDGISHLFLFAFIRIEGFWFIWMPWIIPLKWFLFAEIYMNLLPYECFGVSVGSLMDDGTTIVELMSDCEGAQVGVEVVGRWMLDDGMLSTGKSRFPVVTGTRMSTIKWHHCLVDNSRLESSKRMWEGSKILHKNSWMALNHHHSPSSACWARSIAEPFNLRSFPTFPPRSGK